MGKVHKNIPIFTPIPSTWAKCKDPVGVVTDSQIKLLDPTGVRTRLFAKTNSEAAKVGDILLVRLKNGEPFSGVCMNIRRRGVDTGILLRNQLTRVGVEMWYKIYSPNVTGIEVVQRREKKARRARLYYLRYVSRDEGIGWHSANRVTGNRSTIWVLWRIRFDSTCDSGLCLDHRNPNATSTITRRRPTTRREDERQSSIYVHLASTCIKCINSMGQGSGRHVARIRSQIKYSVCTAAARTFQMHNSHSASLSFVSTLLSFPVTNCVSPRS
jgi:ribosomal protein L19